MEGFEPYLRALKEWKGREGLEYEEDAILDVRSVRSHRLPPIAPQTNRRPSGSCPSKAFASMNVDISTSMIVVRSLKVFDPNLPKRHRLWPRLKCWYQPARIDDGSAAFLAIYSSTRDLAPPTYPRLSLQG